MNIKIQFPASNMGARVRLSLWDAETKKRVWRGNWENNLMFDAGLNLLANGNSSYARIMSVCKVGSGTNPNSISNGAITFTQSGTTITASGAFFTNVMTGGIFKYGTGSGGAESYITFVDSTHATSSVSAAVAIPTVGTVWQVQQTALQTYSIQTSACVPGGANNGYSITGNVLTSFKTFQFAVQGSSYSVNEIGYSTNNANDGTCNGRIVLGSTVVVPNTQYLTVEITLTITQSPSAQISVSNVGTNVNTAGTAMLQYWDCQVPDANGNTTNIQSVWPGNLLDGATPSFSFHVLNDITLETAIVNGTAAVDNNGYAIQNFSQLTNSGQPVGAGISSSAINVNTAGETCYFLLFGAVANTIRTTEIYVIQLTTPIVLPTSLVGSVGWQVQFSRTLVN